MDRIISGLVSHATAYAWSVEAATKERECIVALIRKEAARLQASHEAGGHHTYRPMDAVRADALEDILYLIQGEDSDE